MPRQTVPLKSATLNGSELDARDLASYIAEMSGELATLSRRAGWPLVAYFLDMAQVEAQERLLQNPAPLQENGAQGTRAR